MLQMWMVGCNVDGECAARNESMLRADIVVVFWMITGGWLGLGVKT